MMSFKFEVYVFIPKKKRENLTYEDESTFRVSKMYLPDCIVASIKVCVLGIYKCSKNVHVHLSKFM